MQIYRTYFSYIFGGACKFHPSCSCYAEEALSRFPISTALKLIFCRLIRCHPFQNYQWDPLPTSPSGGLHGSTK